MYEKFVKRKLDLVFALFTLIIVSPLLMIIAIVVRIKLGSPVLFCQKRPGLDGNIFKLFKFRSMTEKKDKNGMLLSDRERLTKTGKMLRSTSLDELPELFNIVKGEMSFVGPRPLLKEYLSLYSEEQKHRHDVRPGLTGLAQVSGRNAISWEERFKKDLEYVKHISFIGDIKIIILTIFKVFQREGVHSDTSATMEKFEIEDHINP